MPGFICEIRKNGVKKNFGPVDEDLNLLVENIEGKNFYIERRTIRKFLNDKVFAEDEKYVVLTEGVILNSKQLMAKYGKNNLKDTIVEMYEKNGETFFNEFRGSFQWLIYTNHVASKKVELADRLLDAL